jgi:hypothetical protein
MNQWDKKCFKTLTRYAAWREIAYECEEERRSRRVQEARRAYWQGFLSWRLPRLPRWSLSWRLLMQVLDTHYPAGEHGAIIKAWRTIDKDKIDLIVNEVYELE